MNRILFYVHFNKNGGLSEYVVYQIQQIKPLFNKVVFITNSKVSAEDKERLSSLYDSFIQRENVGFDFSAWRDGIKSVGWKELESFDSVTLMNDTCFGPVYPIQLLYKKMESTGADIWGITDYAYDADVPEGDEPIPHHIQSYFQVFNRQVVTSKVFQNFWNEVKDIAKVSEVIRAYELRLVPLLENAGFSWRVYFETGSYSKQNNKKIKNYAELAPKIILDNKVPLLKVKSFLYTPAETLVKHIGQSGSDYPVTLIYDHLKSIGITRLKVASFAAKRAIIKVVGVNRIRSFSMNHPRLYKPVRKVFKTILG